MASATPVSQCGNNVKSENEECDDGNDVDGDACETDCTLPRCGNGVTDVGELCLEVVAASAIPGVGPTRADLGRSTESETSTETGSTISCWAKMADTRV